MYPYLEQKSYVHRRNWYPKEQGATGQAVHAGTSAAPTKKHSACHLSYRKGEGSGLWTLRFTGRRLHLAHVIEDVQLCFVSCSSQLLNIPLTAICFPYLVVRYILSVGSFYSHLLRCSDLRQSSFSPPIDHIVVLCLSPHS